MTGLLAFHTATDVCEVALRTGEGVKTLRERRPRAHAERLVPLALEILDGDMSFVRGVAVSAGPGSFTGLRIGVSTAKGIAFGRGVPMYAVSTLAALALDARREHGEHESHIVIPVLRARREELYIGAYRIDDGDVRALADDTVVADDALDQWIAGVTAADDRILIAGPQAAGIAATAASDRKTLDLSPGAASVLALSAGRPDSYIVNDISSFEPYYCKEFVARTPRTSIFDRLPF
ncbi:MAG: tRNA (adenosine(37)-N6)-threonylcarbamoyltransferase complex dimerization subunit type 1 TsaB [Rhodothermales bacterium]|nr:tRNA (adenosine(37)-N6)-threonylcarbamoyltransferase complex dimerization subunit type 1 TsaB [Rhodothermales bacterium]